VSRATTLRVGFLEGAKYPDGTPVAMVAAIQNDGAPAAGIPPRPFFRNMIKDHSSEWPALIEKILQSSKYDSQRTLEMLGEVIVGQLKQSIADTYDPPLSQVTLLLREIYTIDGTRRAGKTGWPSHMGRRALWRAISEVKSGKQSKLSGTAAKPLIWSAHMLNSVDREVE
jgi:hypothetical protein